MNRPNLDRKSFVHLYVNACPSCGRIDAHEPTKGEVQGGACKCGCVDPETKGSLFVSMVHLSEAVELAEMHEWREGKRREAERTERLRPFLPALLIGPLLWAVKK